MTLLSALLIDIKAFVNRVHEPRASERTTLEVVCLSQKLCWFRLCNLNVTQKKISLPHKPFTLIKMGLDEQTETCAYFSKLLPKLVQHHLVYIIIRTITSHLYIFSSNIFTFKYLWIFKKILNNLTGFLYLKSAIEHFFIQHIQNMSHSYEQG